MTIALSHFGLAIDTPLAVPNSRAFRPPSWPPPEDWVCIEDKDGNVVSRYGDSVWNFYPWTGKACIFNFGDGPKLNTRSPVIDPANAELLRQLVAWQIWGPRGALAVSTVENFAKRIRRIIAICSENGILASNLSRYPAIIELVARTLAPSSFEHVVAELDRLRDARQFLGFELLDAAGIQQLKAAQPDHDTEQTEYIPPRIWTYVVNRLKECIDDYLTHQNQIETCFAFCVEAYKNNGAKEFYARTGRVSRNPFTSPRNCTGKRSGITHHGSFSVTARRFGLMELLERWTGPSDDKKGIKQFASYFGLIQHVALADIAAFTLMRIEEAASVRKNCLVWHDDDVYGRIPLIQAETTKTDPDDSALWVTSPSIEPTIRALTSVARMRLDCSGQWTEDLNPYLLNRALEPWGKPGKAAKSGPRVASLSLGTVIRSFPLLFDFNQLSITEDDFKIAKAVCPTLNASRFQIGKPWSLAWHQFRRTGAVNMFASGSISDSTMQLQMKHLTRLMPLYYGRGNSTLHLNEATRVLLVNAQYEALGRQLAGVQSDRFVSPYGDEHKAKLLAGANAGEPVNLLSEGDAQSYEKAARRHQVSFRLTILGGCMKNGPCDGDCVSSVGDCAGGDGNPCANVLFDRNRAVANKTRLEEIIKQLEATPLDTPRYRHLQQEKRGLENYFAYIKRAA
ncbi:MAG TPA: hypothetical protein VI279_12630 [Rhodocyclaceae bacterium]